MKLKVNKENELKSIKLKTESQRENLKRNEKQTCNLQGNSYSDQISQQRPS